MNNILSLKLHRQSNISVVHPRSKTRIESVHQNLPPRFLAENSCENKIEFEEKLATSGNIFKKREDWSILAQVPVRKQNSMHIRLEDEGPYGNDEIRCFVLSHLSSLGVQKLFCLSCEGEMDVYDRFPLVDGTLFTSPCCYDQKSSVPAKSGEKNQFIYGVCLKCLNGENEIKCKFCMKSWMGGKWLQIGTLYKYDIFAAFPCCKFRLTCNKCFTPVINEFAGAMLYFSKYSELIECPNCAHTDYHCVKPMHTFSKPMFRI